MASRQMCLLLFWMNLLFHIGACHAADRENSTTADRIPREVTVPPANLNVPPFYQKYISANGYPIVASAKVNDYALREAAYLVDLMLEHRPDVRAATEMK